MYMIFVFMILVFLLGASAYARTPDDASESSFLDKKLEQNFAQAFSKGLSGWKLMRIRSTCGPRVLRVFFVNVVVNL